MRDKKGQVNTLAPAMMALIFAGIVLILGIVVMQELRDVDTLKTSTTVTNETGIYINSTGDTVATKNGDKTVNFVVTGAWNYSDGTVIPAANYTMDATTGVITNATSVTYSTVNISYTYDLGGEAWDGSNDTLSGLGTFADFWEIIVLAIVITVVIGLLLVVFGGSRKR